MQDHKRNSFITRKSYVFFIIASVCNVLIVQLCSFVNQIILGQELGSDAVSALGICAPAYQISTIIPVIIGMGAMLMALVWIVSLALAYYAYANYTEYPNVFNDYLL